MLATLIGALMAGTLVCVAVPVGFVLPRWAGFIVVLVATVGAALLFFALTGPAGHGSTFPGCVDLVPVWWPGWLP